MASRGSFADHSSSLKKLKERIATGTTTHAAPSTGSAAGGPPVSPMPQAIPPRRGVPGGGGGRKGSPEPRPASSLAGAAAGTPRQQQPAAVVAQESAAAANTTAPARQGSLHPSSPSSVHDVVRVASLESDVRDAADTIEQLRAQLDTATRHAIAAEEEAVSLRAELESACRRHAEAGAAHQQQLAEVEASAKAALERREQHHEEEKQQMLEVVGRMQEEVRSRTSAAASTLASYTATSQELACAEAAQERLQETMAEQREELRQRRWQSSAEGGEDAQSLQRRLDAAEEAARELSAQVAVEAGHAEVLTQRLGELSNTHQAALDELGILQDERAAAHAAHAGSVEALQAAQRARAEEGRQAKERTRLLAAKLRDAEDAAVQQRCHAEEQREEVAFLRAANEEAARGAELLKDEHRSLKEVIASMEGGWAELEHVRGALRGVEAELEAAQLETAAGRTAEAELRRRLDAVCAERAQAEAAAAQSDGYARELEVVAADAAGATAALAARFPQLAGQPLAALAEACEVGLAEKEGLVETLQLLQQENAEIARALDAVQGKIDGDSRDALAAEERCVQERMAREALQEEVAALQEAAGRFEERLLQLDAAAAAERRLRERAEAQRDEAAAEAALHRQRAADVEAGTEEKLRQSAAAKRSLLAKVQALREEEVSGYQQALCETNAVMERNKRQSEVIDSLEAQLVNLRGAAVESLKSADIAVNNAEKVEELMEALRSSNARYSTVHEGELAAMRRELAASKIEISTLHQQADRLREQARSAHDRLRSFDDTRSDTSTALLKSYQSSKAESQQEIDVLLSQKQMSDAELKRASLQVQELRHQLHDTRDARRVAEEENSVLTTQLCAAREDAQRQQRVLLSEIEALAGA